MKTPHSRYRSLVSGEIGLGLLACLYVLIAKPVFAQSWMPTGAPDTNDWITLACSADGSRLVASVLPVPGTYLWMSADRGTNWAPTTGWSCDTVVMSADGNTTTASFNMGTYTTTDYGATWTQLGGVYDSTFYLCASADGTILLSQQREAGGLVYVWRPGFLGWSNYPTALANAVYVTCSADGNTMFAADSTGRFSVSTNGGSAWFETTSAGAGVNLGRMLMCSADGQTLIANSYSWTSGKTQIIVSHDMGQTWKTNTALPNTPWGAVSISADGSKMAIASPRGELYTSGDGGATWVANAVPALYWGALASSSDGETIYAASRDGGIWVKRNTAHPVIRLGASGGRLTLSWIAASQPFVLQQSSTLQGNDWRPVTNVPTLNTTNLSYEMRLEHGTTNSFYRLSGQ